MGFEEYKGKAVTKGICPRCKDEKLAGAVTIRMMENNGETAGRYKQLASRSISMCEVCTIEVYDELVDKLNEAGGGGTRQRSDKIPTGEATQARTHIAQARRRRTKR